MQTCGLVQVFFLFFMRPPGTKGMKPRCFAPASDFSRKMISNHAAGETKLFMARKTKSRSNAPFGVPPSRGSGENHVNRLKAELQTKKAVPRLTERLCS